MLSRSTWYPRESVAIDALKAQIEQLGTLRESLVHVPGKQAALLFCRRGRSCLVKGKFIGA